MKIDYLEMKNLFVFTGAMLILWGAQGCVATRNWVAEQMAPLTGRVTEVEGRVSNVEGQLSNVDGRVNEMGQKVSGLGGRLGETEAKADRSLDSLASLRLERRLVLHLKEGANFAFNSTSLSEAAKREINGFLSDIQGDLRETDRTIFLVGGHSDGTGPAEYNYDLGRRRAEKVARYLIVNNGIDPTKVMTVSYGESAPIDENTTQEGRRKNRRVEILVYNETINSSLEISAAR